MDHKSGEEVSAAILSESGIDSTENSDLPTDSSIACSCRAKLEEDILFVATSTPVQTALVAHIIETGKVQPAAFQGSIAHALRKGGREGLKREFEKGAKIMLEASCDRRLEISHLMVGMLWEDREDVKSADLVEWFFREARMLADEMNEGEAKELTRIFGLR